MFVFSRDLDEVIGRANATNLGLSAGVFTDCQHTSTRAIKAGTVWVNSFAVVDACIFQSNKSSSSSSYQYFVPSALSQANSITNSVN